MLDIAQFWIYNAYSLEPPTDNSDMNFNLHKNFYVRQLLFIIKILEDNINIILFNSDSFSQWVKML